MKKDFTKVVKEIPFGTNPENKKEAAFVLIHANIRPYIHYDSPKHDRSLVCKSFLVSNRKDNTKGFIGGTIDKGEKILDGLLREIDEEYGFKLDVEKLREFCSHDSGKIIGHLYQYEVDEAEYFKIISTINKNFCEFYSNHATFLEEHSKHQDIEKLSREKFGISHFYAETRGVEAMMITNREFDNENLLSNLYSGTGRVEIEKFLEKYNLK